jgi:hypothetical protein
MLVTVDSKDIDPNVVKICVFPEHVVASAASLVALWREQFPSPPPTDEQMQILVSKVGHERIAVAIVRRVNLRRGASLPIDLTLDDLLLGLKADGQVMDLVASMG